MKTVFRALWSGFFLLFIFPSLACSATGIQTHVWGIPHTEIQEYLKMRNYDFLDSVPVSSYSKILKIDKGAPYYLGLHLSKAGRIKQALDFYALAVKKSPEPWKSLAQYELTLIGTPAERLVWIETLLRDKKRSGTIIELSQDVLKEKREVLLFQEGRFSDLPIKPFEWILARGLSSSLVFSAEKLLAESADNASFEALCLQLRLAVYERNYEKAWIIARPMLETLDLKSLPFELPRALLSDFGLAALYGSVNVSADARLLRSLSEKASSIETVAGTEMAHVFVFYAARLYQRSGSALERKETRDLFLTAVTYARTSREYDSSIWYWLDAGKGRSKSVLLEELKVHAPLWKDPAWYSDILEPLIVTLIREKDWKSLVFLAQNIGPYAESEIRTRLDYLSARSGLLSHEDTKNAYVRAWEGDHNEFYYRLLSAEALGFPLESASHAVPKRNIGDKTDALPFNITEIKLILDGYLTWFLADNLYSAGQKWYPILPSEIARWYAGALSERGLYADAARIVLSAVRPSNVSVTHEDLEFLYPRPWLDEVRASSTEVVTEPLLYALLRSESYYQSAVVSRSGAIGLTQLMPATAGDIARKLRVSDYDLTDPKTNIQFGAFYLNELIGRLDGNTMHALFSYNAGITRVRSWLRTSPVSEPDLFLEALPYAETREYGRKVLAAAAVYGYLYYQKTTGQSVHDLF